MSGQSLSTRMEIRPTATGSEMTIPKIEVAPEFWRHGMRLQRIWIALLVMLIVSLTACVPVRAPDADLFTDQTLAFIVMGETTKKEISGELTRQAAQIAVEKPGLVVDRQEYYGGAWWLYAQERRKREWVLFVPGGGEAVGGVDHRFLLIKFDERGIVSDYEVSSPQERHCSQKGVCLVAGKYTLLAAKEDDQNTKQFDLQAGHCGIYVYGQVKLFGVSAFIDDRPIGPIVNNEHFYFRELEPGLHKLSGTYSVYGTPAVAEFECSGGETIFFNLEERSEGRFATRYWVEIERRDEVAGRKEVTDRWLALSELD